MNSLDKYKDLIGSYVTGKINSQSFERQYLDMFKMEIKEFSSDTYSILNDLFSSVDAYCHDTNLRELGDLDDNELLVCAEKALKGII